MYYFFIFLLNHWFLSLSFLVVFFLFIFIEFFYFNSSHSLVSSELVNLMNRKTIVIVDFRDKNSFFEGHILGACNISLDDSDLFLKKYLKKTIILVCKNGKISSKKSSFLRKNGYDDVKFLKGGMESWIKEGYPIN